MPQRSPHALPQTDWRARRAPARRALALALAAVSCAATLAPPAAARPAAAREKAVAAADQKAYVLAAPVEHLRAVGQHVIIGYHGLGQLRPLLEKGALGGIFVSDHNAGKFATPIGLAMEIAAIRAVGRDARPRPLWVAADHEGGLVSRLSPPLPRPASLQILAGIPAASASPPAPEADGSAVDAPDAITAHAQAKSRHLASLGINLNFAPVVDLRPAKRLRGDRQTVLRRRAISSDPATVSAVARNYCEGLLSSGVLCTLKHFPGLSDANADTHVRPAKVTTARIELDARHWQPYRDVLSATPAAVMVGHMIATEIDPDRPASMSSPVIDGVLRRTLGFDGLVVTDDLWMGAIRKREGGMGAAAVEALRAGADLVLLSRDPDRLYPVLYEMLRAYETGIIARDTLTASRARLDAAARLLSQLRPVAPTAIVPLPRENPVRRLRFAGPKI